MLRGKLIAVNAYINIEKRPQISNLTLYLKKQEKEQIKSKASRRKEFIQIRLEINKIVTRKAEIQSILRDYYKQLYANKMDNLEKWTNS